MRSRLSLALVFLTGALATAEDYKNATHKGSLQVKVGKPVPNVVFQYEATDPKTKKTETKTVAVLLSTKYVNDPGPLDEQGKPIKLEQIVNYFKPGVVADLKTEKRMDGVEYVVGFKAVKAPPAKQPGE